MKTISLTPSEQQRVHNLKREIRKSGFAELDQDRIREDFYGLYSDIIQELNAKCNSKVVNFYEFSELMDDVAKLTTPEIAYGYGRTAKQAGIDAKQGFTEFMREVSTVINESEAAKQRDELFHDLCEVLGDTRSLMTEFVEMHARVNVEKYYIDRFFDLGYTSEPPEKEWKTPTSTTMGEKEVIERGYGGYVFKDKNGKVTGRCGGWA